MANEATLKDTTASLARIQEFDVVTLSRTEDLGTHLNFSEIVTPASEVVGLYKRIPPSSLNDLTDGQLNEIKSAAQSDFQLFDQIIKFNPTSGDAVNVRNQLIATVRNRRDQLFGQIWHYIAYGVARTTDTSLLESQARAAIQSISDQAKEMTDALTKSKDDAEVALKAIRDVAAEQGVSQQAHYFKSEADQQETLAGKWLTKTYYFAIAVGVFALFSLFFHKIPWIQPTTNSELVQFVTSKLLIFAVLSFMLILAAKNYATHKHNAIVNRHRQNALLTYRALVQAAADRGTEDIILAHAASCIFAPQETGFANVKGEGAAKSVLELMTKATSKSSE